jgi:Tfp pilus assembly protein PilF
MSCKPVCLLLFLSGIAPAVSSQAVPSRKDQIALHERLAQQYLAQKRPDQALPELQKVVALDPANVDAQGNLGVLLYFRGDLKGAVPHLRKAVESRSDLWKIQALLGIAEARTTNGRAGRADLETSLPHLAAGNTQLEVGRMLIDEYTASDDLDKAAAVASQLLSSRPTDPSLLYLSYRLDSDLAGRAMLTLALSAPASAEMHQVMARELARHGDDEAAIANYREAIRLNPNLPGLHSELGDLLFHSQDQKLQDQAKAEFEAAVVQNPQDEKALLSLGMIAARDSDPKTAYADEARAVELAPNDTDACTELAKLLVETNRRDEAQQLLERAIQSDPTNFVAHYRLATVYRQQGKAEEAKQQVAEYLKYKQIQDKLQKIFETMRVASGKHPDTSDSGPM